MLCQPWVRGAGLGHGMLQVGAGVWARYARRPETRREHLQELYTWLGLAPFGVRQFRTSVQQLTELAAQTDRGMVLATAFRLRAGHALVMPVGIIGSLIVSPYLHASDLCLLAVAAWMIWEERPVPAWRAPLAFGWILASPFLYQLGLSPSLNHWPLLEYALLLAIVVVAWRPLTGPAALRTRAPA